MTAKVKGKRSPKWALMQRMTIPCEDGTEYLTRLRIVQTPWFGVMMHDLLGPDKEDLHDHPWSFVSFILRGSYTERVDRSPGYAGKTRYVRTWNRWSWHKMDANWAHRIERISPGTRSIIFTGKRKRDWGFWVPAGFGPFAAHRWVSWKAYESNTYHTPGSKPVSP